MNKKGGLSLSLSLRARAERRLRKRLNDRSATTGSGFGGRPRLHRVAFHVGVQTFHLLEALVAQSAVEITVRRRLSALLWSVLQKRMVYFREVLAFSQ